MLQDLAPVVSKVTTGCDPRHRLGGNGTRGWCPTSPMPATAMATRLMKTTAVYATLVSGAVSFSLTIPRPGHAGQWFACAIDASTGAKALVMGSQEVQLHPQIPFQAKPMEANPKLMLTPGSRAGRCYLSEQQRRALHQS